MPKLIRDWDLSTDIENRGAAMSTCVIGAEWLAEQKGEPTPDVADAFYHCADRLMAATGRIDPLWGDVNRHVRGDINLPVGGGPRYLAGYLCSGYGGRWLSNQYSRRRSLLFCLLGRARVQKFVACISLARRHWIQSHPTTQIRPKTMSAEILHDPLFDSELRKDKIARRYRPGE